MIRLRCCLSVLLVLFAIPASAQGLAGKWKADIDTPGFGVIPTTFAFTVSGTKVTGTFANSFIPTPIPITDGTVKSNMVSFTLKLDTVTIAYKGPLKGNKLTLTTSVVEGPTPPGVALTFTATREE